MRKTKKYPLEEKAEELLQALINYLFKERKDKVDKITHAMEIIAWLLFTAALLLRRW